MRASYCCAMLVLTVLWGAQDEAGSQPLRRIAVHRLGIQDHFTGSFAGVNRDPEGYTIALRKEIRGSQLLNLEPLVPEAPDSFGTSSGVMDTDLLKRLSSSAPNADFHIFGHLILSDQTIEVLAFVVLDHTKYAQLASDCQLFKIENTFFPPDLLKEPANKNIPVQIAELLTRELEYQFEQRISVSLGSFRYLGKDTQFVYLEEPIRRALLSSLGTSPRIRLVIADTTSKHAPTSSGNPPQANYVIEGSYFSIGQSVVLEVSAVQKETRQVIHSVKGILNVYKGEEFISSINMLGSAAKEAIERDFKSKEDQRIRITEKISIPDSSNPVSVSVAVEPPYPVNSYTENLTLDVARTLYGKLRWAKSRWGSAPFRLSALNESRLVAQVASFLGRDSVGAAESVDYLVVVRVEYPQPRMDLVATLYPLRNPLLQSVTGTVSLDNIDGLKAGVQDLAEQVLRHLAERSRVLPDSQAVKAMLEEELPQSVWGLRVRGLVHGFTEETKKIYLGNHLRANVEVGFIHYAMPYQMELNIAYDFGKPKGDFLVYGRYVTLLLKHNWAGPASIHNSRFWIGGGPTMVNVVRVPPLSPSGGDVKFGVTLSTGLDVLVWRCIFVDISGGILLMPWSIPGFRDPDHYTEGNLTSFFLGFGIGVRI